MNIALSEPLQKKYLSEIGRMFHGGKFNPSVKEISAFLKRNGVPLGPDAKFQLSDWKAVFADAGTQYAAYVHGDKKNGLSKQGVALGIGQAVEVVKQYAAEGEVQPNQEPLAPSQEQPAPQSLIPPPQGGVM